MNTSKTPNINEASDFFVMYNELCTVSYQKRDFEGVLKSFYKTAKYCEILYAETAKTPNITEPQLEMLKKFFSNISGLEAIALKELGIEKSDYKHSEDELDEYEELFYSEEDQEVFYNKIAQRLSEVGANVSAVTFLKRALQINPNNYENYRLIADCYCRMLDKDKAIAFYEKYNEYQPNNPSVYNSLGTVCSVFNKYGELDKQRMYFEKAVELMPDYVDAIRHLAITYRYSDENEKAMECFSKLLKLEPNNDDYFNYACQKIRLGDFEEGWKFFEHRFDRETSPVTYPEMKKPRWQGENIEDKTLLVQSEQGFGDSIQFLRYVPQIKAKKVIFRVQDGLVDLFKENMGSVEFVKKSTPIENIAFDCHVPIMSLPYVLKASADNIPLSEGYIKADEKKVEDFKKNFFDNDSFKIGIAWHGAKSGNEVRNIPINYFYPLTKLENAKVYSFQKDSADELGENLPSDVEIIDLGKEFKDFSDTAAALANVDLLITSDNAVFNLAGAMAKKSFLLLNRDSEWRWFLDEETTPWYDSVRIFKKKYELEPWDVLMQRAIEELHG